MHKAIFPLLITLLLQAQSGPDPNGLLLRLQAAAGRDRIVLTTIVFFLLAGLVRLVTAERSRIRAAVLLFCFSLILILISVAFEATTLGSIAAATHWGGMLIGAFAFINLLSILIFDAALKSIHIQAPRILRDLLIALAYVGAALALLSRGGVSLSGIITTSAVISAVIGFALQDTLGNIMAGVALQFERTITVGDWVKIDQQVGRVVEIRWRYTAIETRNWDTVIIPNSVLMKAQVVLLGRRDGVAKNHRQWVYFNVDFRVTPTKVISAVDQALQAEALRGVATEPKPHCILFDFRESYCHYAVRYWLTDLAVDDPTDSLVRTRIYFALKRMGIPLSIPAQSVFVTKESEGRKEFKQEQELDRRMKALAKVELFQALTDEEKKWLAERLRVAPFTKGEAMTRQGAEAHWLYIITKGSAEVQVTVNGGQSRSVATLGAGDFFGEMSLMTGEKRSATVVALEDTECYRLDKEVFQDVLHERPEIAEHISQILVERRLGLEAARDELDAEARQNLMSREKGALIGRIYQFFHLHGK
ncbi:MAG TPA: mechanosensitive ion channel family protein [Blastocatellia bacterium]|nr:mechanosensitive ion channel family protein [Blastocatellia bacterium]